MAGRRRLIALAMTLPALASGCTSDLSASPPSTPTATTVTSVAPPTTTTTSEPPRPTEPPPVTRTLDITRYREHPCDLLTREQQSALSLPQPQRMPVLCRWEQSRPKISVTVDLLIRLNYMLQIYLQSNEEEPGSDSKKWVVFDPITVGGQPAVVLNPTTHQSNSRVLVATSPVDCIDITVTIETGADARATAIAIAEQIVDNLTKQ